MALHEFGPAIEVQAGGGDLRFPHHACQAAMAEAFTGVTPFARAWLNAGVVRVDGAKMAKSVGNLVLVGDLLDSYPAAALRLLILDRRWDQDWDYDRAGLDAAAARLSGCNRLPGDPTALPRPWRRGGGCRPRRPGSRSRRARRAEHRRRTGRRLSRARRRVPARALVAGAGASFWDAMILRSAKELGCQILHSEDLNPGQEYEGVLLRNPFLN